MKEEHKLKKGGYEFPNNYDKWGAREGRLMHDLQLRWHGRFIWTNLLWVFLATWKFIGFWPALVSVLPAFILLMKIDK